LLQDFYARGQGYSAHGLFVLWHDQLKGEKLMDTKDVERGLQFAPEFIDHMAVVAQQTLENWMRSNGVPDDVVGLANDAVMLERYSIESANGDLASLEAAELYQNLPAMTERIARLGGKFDDGDLGRENPLGWSRTE
jgi:hypothetical protein